MASKRLIEAAREVVAAADKCQDWNGTHLGHTLSELRIAIAAAEQQAADDDEPVTVEWCRERFIDTSYSDRMKRFELAPSVRIVFELHDSGEWCIPELWIGFANTLRRIAVADRRHIRQLVELLKGE
jgi:hypothetical protein